MMLRVWIREGYPEGGRLVLWMANGYPPARGGRDMEMAVLLAARDLPTSEDLAIAERAIRALRLARWEPPAGIVDAAGFPVDPWTARPSG